MLALRFTKKKLHQFVFVFLCHFIMIVDQRYYDRSYSIQLSIIVQRMISQVTANPKSATSNEYGFYAIPKTIKPKSKYRETEYQDEKSSKQEQPALLPIEDREEDVVERDFFVDEPPFPEFMPKEPGIDKQVQVEDQQLFDFDLEVEPLLQILVGQAVFKSRNQLQQEEEERQAKKKLSQFQKKRQAELMITQRLQAHNRRRNQEGQRRIYQHGVYTQQKKLVLKKLHAFNQSKRALLNLKSQVLNDLESEGFLRYNIFVRLRSQFLPWLYDQIDKQLIDQSSITSAGEQIMSQKQDELLKKHKQNMNKQSERRKQILDKREKDRQAEEERKKKKAIRKERLNLNKTRIQKQDKIYQTLKKGQKLQNISKAQISDNRPKDRAVVYVSGGAILFISQILSALSQEGVCLSQQKLEIFITKILKELQSPIDLTLPSELKDLISNLEAEGKQDPKLFNSKLQNTIEDLVQNQDVIANSYNQNITYSARQLKQIIKVLLRVYLTQALPTEEKKLVEEATEQNQPPPEEKKQQLTQAQKVRLAIKVNVKLNFQGVPESKPSQIIRIRYPRKEAQQSQQQQQVQEQYIQVFDGEGWQRLQSRIPQRQPVQSAISYNFSGFETAIVYDQISNSFYGLYLLGLLNGIGVAVDKAKYEQIAGKLSQKYSQHLRHKYGGKDIPIYDVQYDY